MEKNYFLENVDRIIGDKKLEYPLNFAMGAAWILAHHKGSSLKILNMKETSPLADYFILGTATNPTQAKAISDDLLFAFKRHKLESISREGLTNCDWLLLDFADVIVHIFQEDTRELVAIEELWKDAETVAIPEEYYYGNAPSAKKEEDETAGYF